MGASVAGLSALKYYPLPLPERTTCSELQTPKVEKSLKDGLIFLHRQGDPDTRGKFKLCGFLHVTLEDPLIFSTQLIYYGFSREHMV